MKNMCAKCRTSSNMTQHKSIFLVSIKQSRQSFVLNEIRKSTQKNGLSNYRSEDSFHSLSRSIVGCRFPIEHEQNKKSHFYSLEINVKNKRRKKHSKQIILFSRLGKILFLLDIIKMGFFSSSSMLT